MCGARELRHRSSGGVCGPALGLLVAQPSQIVYKYSLARPQIGELSACQLKAMRPSLGSSTIFTVDTGPRMKCALRPP